MKTIWKQLLNNTIVALGRCAIQFLRQILGRVKPPKEEDEKESENV